MTILSVFKSRYCHKCLFNLFRISRILESPRGSALLVGVGGFGKQSLSRLAAFISTLEVLQIQLKKGYGVADLKVKLDKIISNLAPSMGLSNSMT